MLQLVLDTPCVTFRVCTAGCPAWQRRRASVEEACKQWEAAVIVVPLEFTSAEADRQLEGNRGNERGGSKY